MLNRSPALAAAACWIAGALIYLLAEALTAARYGPRYSYTHNAISDLGTAASPSAAVMNAAFCLQGVLFLLGATLAVRAQRPRRTTPFVVFAACNAVGNVLVATVHSGEGPLHVVGAILAIAGGNAAAVAGAGLMRTATGRRISLALGILGLLSAAMWPLAVAVPPAAVWERISVYTILGWQLFAAAALLPARGEGAQRTERDRSRR